MDRRRLIALGGTAGATLAADCAELFSDPSFLAVALLNFTEERREVTVEAFRTDADRTDTLYVEIDTEPESERPAVSFQQNH